MFDIIEVALIGQKDMYDNLNIVHCHPTRITQSINSQRFDSKRLARYISHTMGNGLYLNRRSTTTYHELLADGVRDMCQVSHNYPTAFLVLNTFYDGIHQFICLLLHPRIINKSYSKCI